VPENGEDEIGGGMGIRDSVIFVIVCFCCEEMSVPPLRHSVVFRHKTDYNKARISSPQRIS
jgi:hypothetical protein